MSINMWKAYDAQYLEEPLYLLIGRISIFFFIFR